MPDPTSVPAGLVVVDKPAGMTSHDVVARVRRLAGTRKVGHAGTLDPMATGVLLLGVGRATRLLGHLMLTRKEYSATVRLGVSTDSDDADGEVVATADVSGVTEAQVRSELVKFVGEIDQVPSSVSAIKVDGRRAYDRVRAGEQVALAARKVTIDAIEVARVNLPEVDVVVSCSSGTYIRAIARDLGASLGVGGHLTSLRRTRVGPFEIDDAHPLSELESEFSMLSIDDVARRTFPVLELSDEQATDVRYGRPLAVQIDALTAVFAPGGEFLALYEPRGSDQARPLAVFTG